MGAAYGEELRLRVVRAIDGGMNKWQTHQTFQVARTTIDKWLKLREETGEVKALAGARRGRKAILADCPEVHAFFERHKEKRLQQMTQAWQQEHGEQFTINAFHKALKRLGYSRKKSPAATGSAIWVRETASQQN